MKIVITKSRLIGLLAIFVLGFLVLRPGDEPSDSDESDGKSESATDRQLRPREPALLEPSGGYGIARRADTDDTRPAYGRSEPYRQAPHPQGYGASEQYGSSDWARSGGYRFRPLSKREQERMRKAYSSQYPNRYSTPYSTYSSQDYRTAESEQSSAWPTPPSYSTPPTYPGGQQEAYSFRPLEKSPAAQGRWEGPYDNSDYRFDSYRTDPWMAPPDPQWGSMPPPAQRMYPSLGQGSNRQFTAR